MYQRIMSENK